MYHAFRKCKYKFLSIKISNIFPQAQITTRRVKLKFAGPEVQLKQSSGLKLSVERLTKGHKQTIKL